ncbi:pyrimidine dimer DNA glycosylase/endonuclease V [uncultured Shewanella sp.]|uniref:pyrimidine dimer DNA glycosylase/endonuclease V n=1 Tax=uncultured Shewanella sp. TaxID=173975 RepID=UPI00261B6CE2|nr:pyrimidine dimer DNA glycosylase/endonuclease V [uncultured Shewanella sp.]
MNIFVLDNDIEHCAQYHCDQHVIKMILESVQILCTALNKKGFVAPYRSTHIHHPCVLWVEASFDNFLWLKELTRALNQEYRYRYDKRDDHKSIAVLDTLKDDKYKYEHLGLTEFAQAMPDQYKIVGDPIKAYRQFYLGDKMHFAKWRKRPAPDWITHPDG